MSIQVFCSKSQISSVFQKKIAPLPTLRLHQEPQSDLIPVSDPVCTSRNEKAVHLPNVPCSRGTPNPSDCQANARTTTTQSVSPHLSILSTWRNFRQRANEQRNPIQPTTSGQPINTTAATRRPSPKNFLRDERQPLAAGVLHRLG